MRFSIATAFLLLAPTYTLAHPQAAASIQQRDALAVLLDQPVSEASDHWKRKGGGGGGGRGGGSSSSSGSSSSGSSSSGSSSSSSGGRTSGSSGSSGTSSSGGRSAGSYRTYGGGKYYGGGAVTPYRAGGRSPKGIVAVPLIGAALLIYPGLWFYGAYAYPYGRPYSFYNRTGRRNRTATPTSTSATPSSTAPTKRSNVDRFFEIEERQETEEGVQETKPVTCLCSQAPEAICGCDENDDDEFLNTLVGDGDYSKLNSSLVSVADINGTSTIVINGTLPEGTVTDDATGASAAASTLSIGGSMVGYWVMVALVGFTCFLV